ncbi:DMT family transporter [Pontiellaceae bacterium B12219]|nr:DMT family transporter [Pontiellaceae bacterium B12219]
MSVPLAYLIVVLIWSTTPLAIKWSGEGAGFLFGVTARMLIGVVLVMTMIKIMRLAIPWDRSARRIYLFSGLGIFSAMLSVYWAAQFIPSGWISVLYGLTPIATGIMARLWLNEQGLTLSRLISMLIALSGLAIIFLQGAGLGAHALLGVSGVLISVLSHSASSVWIKREGRKMHGLIVAGGGLLVSLPLFLLTYFLSGELIPQQITVRSMASIIYLGVIGSGLGFALYYYVLHHVEATKVALITLITPVSALLIGSMLNGERIDAKIGFGTALIMIGLAGFLLSKPIMQKLRHYLTETP